MRRNSNSLIGLKYLVNYHRLTGNTYLGACLDGKFQFITKLALIVWNLLLLAQIGWHFHMEYQWSSQGNNSTLGLNGTDLNESPKSKNRLIDVLNAIRSLSYSSQSFIIFVYLMVRGEKILQSVKDCHQLVTISTKDEKRIGLFIALIQFCYACAFNLFHFVTHYEFDKVQISIALHIQFTSSFFLLFNTQLTILSLIAYQSSIVSRKLAEMSKCLTINTNLKTSYLFISHLSHTIKRTDSLISVYNAIALAFNTLNCISFLCVIAVDIESIGIFVSALLESLSVLMILCLVSDMIPRTYSEFVFNLNKTFTEYSVENASNLMYIRVILNHMNDIKHEMGFTAYNLFFVNTNTFLSCMTLILSYSVILIQTYK